MSERLLSGVDLADIGPGLDGSAGSELLLAELPQEYGRLLRSVNGFSVNGGMNRIFGLRPDPHMDVRSWNEEHHWRFAWNGRADSYLFFGGTAFGDQYGFRRSGGGQGFDDGVYLLDANLLEAELVADSFGAFLAREIVQNAGTPWDPLVVPCLEAFGRVESQSHLVLTPSLLLGGVEDVANMMKMESRTAMICGGDIYAAVMSCPDEAVVAGVKPWFDEQGRPRLRVVFQG